MTEDHKTALSCSARVVMHPLTSTRLMTMPLSFRHKSIGTVVTISVTLETGSTIRLQFACDEVVKNKVMQQGSVEREFTHFSVSTSDGQATLIESVEIDGRMFEILEHYH
jgi:hypothetical protein